MPPTSSWTQISQNFNIVKLCIHQNAPNWKSPSSAARTVQSWSEKKVDEINKRNEENQNQDNPLFSETFYFFPESSIWLWFSPSILALLNEAFRFYISRGSVSRGYVSSFLWHIHLFLKYQIPIYMAMKLFFLQFCRVYLNI